MNIKLKIVTAIISVSIGLFILINVAQLGQEHSTQTVTTVQENNETETVTVTEYVAPQPTPEFNFTEAEYDLIYRIVQAEAGGEDEIGKIMVVNVLLNRLRSEKFPDTMTEIIMSPGQFSPVGNGKINSVTVDQGTINAVYRALYYREDYSNGGLYFANLSLIDPNSSTYRWFTSMELVATYGGHSFFK